MSDYSIESRQPWYQSEIRLGVHELSILVFQLVCDLCDVISSTRSNLSSTMSGDISRNAVFSVTPGEIRYPVSEPHQ